jgi:hypothetical protein
MRKWLFCAGIIAVAIVFVAYEQHYTREKYDAESEKACIQLAISVEEKHACEKEAQNRKDYAPWWYALMTWPEGITTWAIIGTGLVIAWQSSETRKSARAALLAAEYTVNLERPYLYVEMEYGESHPSDPEMDQWYNIGIVNHGHTIAEIVGCSDPALHVIEGRDAILTSVPPPVQIREIVPPVRVMPGKQPRVDLTVIRDADVMKVCGSEERQRQLIQGENSAYATGVIQFRDLLRPPTEAPHELYWCCRVKFGDQGRLVAYLAGPKEYNFQT